MNPRTHSFSAKADKVDEPLRAPGEEWESQQSGRSADVEGL